MKRTIVLNTFLTHEQRQILSILLVILFLCSTLPRNTARAASDIRIQKVVDNPAPHERGFITYRVTAENLGPEAIEDLIILDQLPSEVTYLGSGSDHGYYNPQLMSWQIAPLAVGETATLQIVGGVEQGTAGRSLTNLASLGTSVPTDTNGANNVDEAVITPLPGTGQANLFMDSLFGPSQPVFRGNLFESGIGMFNFQFNSTSQNARFKITLPPGLSFVSGTVFTLEGEMACEQDSGCITCDAGDVDNSSTVFLNFTALAEETGIFDIVVSGISDTPDLFLPDNITTGRVEVLAAHPSGETVDQTLEAGDPVDTRNGVLYSREPPDLDLRGVMGLELERYYGSFMEREGFVQSRLGPNWQHNFDLSMSVQGSNATVVLKRGRVLFFQDAGTKWILTGRRSVPFQLVPNGADFVLGDPRNQFMYHFSSNGSLTRIEDGKGNAHALTYLDDRLVKVSDGLGRTLNFSYTAGGLLSNVTDGIRSVQYGHTASNLTRFIDAMSNTTQYVYDNHPEFPGLMTASIRPEGNVPFRQAYTPDGRVQTQADSYGNTSRFDYVRTLFENSTIVTDPLGQTRTHVYSPEGEILRLIDESGNEINQGYLDPTQSGRPTSVQDREGNTTEFEYDETHGQLTRTDSPGIAPTEFRYEPRMINGLSFQDLTTISNQARGRFTYTYDPRGLMTSASSAARVHQRFTYNAMGQVFAASNALGGVERYTYDASGNRTSVTDSDIGVTILQYDGLSRLTNVLYPDGTRFIAAYDALDRVTSMIDERGNTRQFEYDRNGRLTRRVDPAGGAQRFFYDGNDQRIRTVDKLGQTNLTSYTPFGDIATRTDRGGNTDRFTYDKRHWRTATVGPNGGSNRFTYSDDGLLVSASNPEGETTTYENDALGFRTAVIDPLGRRIEIKLDDKKRAVRVTDAFGRAMSFNYDDLGRLTGGSRGAGISSTYRHNDLGEITSLTDPNSNTWTFSYSPMGRLDGTVDPLNRTNRFRYDARGRILQLVHQDGVIMSNTYDGVNNVIQRSYSDGLVMSYAYDALNRVTNTTGMAIKRDLEGRTLEMRQAGITFRNEYDAAGHRTNVRYNNDQFAVHYTYDNLGRVTRVSDDLTGAGMRFAYDRAGRVTSLIRSNGVQAAYTYDAAGQNTRLLETAPAGTLLDLRQTFDGSGKMMEADYLVSPITLADFVTTEIQNLAYDTGAQISTATYQYDARGRLTTFPGGSLTWDGASRLTQVNDITYTYNGLGDPMTRVESGATNHYFYNPSPGLRPLLAERNENAGQFTKFYVYHPNGTLLYLIDAATGNVSYYHYESRGSTLALTDEGGNVTDTYAYAPYGQMLSHQGPSDQPFTFVGKYGIRHEPSADLYHMRARWFNPDTGRFVSFDPVWPFVADPATLNPYQYAMFDPINCIDPMGAFTLIELMIVIAIIAIIAAIAIPNLLRARASANEASAISSLRTLVSSQAMFYQGDIEGDGSYDYATNLVELTTDGLIDNVLGNGTRSGYVFGLSSGSEGVTSCPNGWDRSQNRPQICIRHDTGQGCRLTAPNGREATQEFTREAEANQHADGPLGHISPCINFITTWRSASAPEWAATATPRPPGSTGRRYFFVNETGVIRARRTDDGNNAIE